MLFKDKNHSILDPPLNLLDMQQFDFKDANQSGNRYVDADEFMLLQWKDALSVIIYYE